MSEFAFCAKCGSDKMIPTARFLDDTHGSRKDTELGLAVNPYAMIFKDETRVPLRTMVCGACGYVELYATRPDALWKAYERQKANSKR